MVEELPSGYYLDNFRFVLEFVTRLYGDLLTPAELAWSVDFERLGPDAGKLYVRLCSRKGPLFRDDKLSYPEIDMAAAIPILASAGYLDFAADAGAEELTSLLTKPELADLCDGRRHGQNRAALATRLLAEMPTDQLRTALPFLVLRPLHLDTLQTYKLLFFGNSHQDFTEFVLRDLGISPYEQYTIHPEDRLFDERHLLDETLRLHELDERARAAVEDNDAAAMLDVAAEIGSAEKVTLNRRGARIRNRLARQLERLDMPQAALTLYEMSEFAPSRERRARILHKQGMTEEALALCHRIFADPEDEAEYEFAASFARRMLAKDDPVRDVFPDLRSNLVNHREIVVAPAPEVRVEELARRWFEARGDCAAYVENALFPGLFGLAFWDIIFRTRKGVFFNPFQRGPSDLFEVEFRDANESLIKARLNELEDTDRFRRRVLDTFAAKYGIANWFVTWQVLNEPLLMAAFERVPVAHVLLVFRRLLRDLKRNRSGFPDLIVFPAAGGYLLAEVKGPGDTLQDNQKRWLRFFGEAGMTAEVVDLCLAAQ